LPNIFRAIAGAERNVALFQKGGHRRINILVEPVTVKPRSLRAAATDPIAVPQIRENGNERRFFHSNSLRGVANYASERRKRVIPSAGEGPHLLLGSSIST